MWCFHHRRETKEDDERNQKPQVRNLKPTHAIVNESQRVPKIVFNCLVGFDISENCWKYPTKPFIVVCLAGSRCSVGNVSCFYSFKSLSLGVENPLEY